MGRGAVGTVRHAARMVSTPCCHAKGSRNASHHGTLFVGNNASAIPSGFGGGGVIINATANIANTAIAATSGGKRLRPIVSKRLVVPAPGRMPRCGIGGDGTAGEQGCSIVGDSCNKSSTKTKKKKEFFLRLVKMFTRSLFTCSWAPISPILQCRAGLCSEALLFAGVCLVPDG